MAHGTQIIRPADVVAEPWANGLGATRIMATGPAWRISIATITGRMPFSSFPGMDRTLIPLSASGITLEIAGEQRIVRPQFAAQFRGEDEVIGDSGSHPATVVNLMVRRTLTSLSCEILRAETLDLAGVAAIVVLGGRVLVGYKDTADIEDAALLLPGTVVLPAAGAPCVLTFDAGTVAVLR